MNDEQRATIDEDVTREIDLMSPQNDARERRKTVIGGRFNLLDRGWLELQDMMGDDLAIVNAARTSFLDDSKGAYKDKKLLFYLMRHRHTSPFEQVEFKFRVHAPVLVWWQWVRHRTWNFNAQSGRYVAYAENEFYTPAAHEWRKQSKSNKQASDGVIDLAVGAELTNRLLDHYARSYALYSDALEKGVAREQARVYLPGWSLYYTFVAKVDASNLMKFLIERMAEDAQYEIRVYARAIYEHVFRPLLPWTAEAFESIALPIETAGAVKGMLRLDDAYGKAHSMGQELSERARRELYTTKFPPAT